MTRSKNSIVKILLSGIFFLVLLNKTYSQTKIEKLDRLLGMYAEYGVFNGSVLVSENGQVIYKKGFGLANMEWDIPNKPDTRHRLGSITKQFTSMLIMQLVQQGKIKLDATVSTYLPDYPKKNGEAITIHHLLTHTSGIPNYTSYPGFNKSFGRNAITPDEFVSFFADSALMFKPGERFDYSNSGYFLLGVIIEKITGKKYEQVLQEQIFTPLKMINSGYDHASTVLANRASGYEKNGSEYNNSSYLDMSVPFSAGALYSTVEDLYLWDQALYTEKLLTKKNMDLLFEKHIPAFRNYYGYGWQIGEMAIGSTDEKVKTIGHSGGINGFSTLLTRIPSEKSLIVLLNNTGGAPLGEMTIAINGILHDKPYALPKKSVAFSLYELIEKDGLASAGEYYKAVRDSGTYNLSENEMNQAGYQLLQAGKAKEAAFVFKLNVEAFPASSNVYDSYGEALMAMGNKKEGIENYKRSVQLNPGNTNGINILKEAGVNTDDLIKKVPVEQLHLLEGEYLETGEAAGSNGSWKIVFAVVNGELTANDRGYKYKLVPTGDYAFVNPDDGATLIFDARDQQAITLLLGGRIKFRKVK